MQPALGTQCQKPSLRHVQLHLTQTNGAEKGASLSAVQATHPHPHTTKSHGHLSLRRQKEQRADGACRQDKSFQGGGTLTDALSTRQPSGTEPCLLAPCLQQQGLMSPVPLQPWGRTAAASQPPARSGAAPSPGPSPRSAPWVALTAPGEERTQSSQDEKDAATSQRLLSEAEQ